MEGRGREVTLAAQIFTEDPALRKAAEQSPHLDRLRSESKAVDVDGATFHLVEGDLLLDDDELQLHALRLETRQEAEALGVAPPLTQAESLVATAPGGKIVRWKVGLNLAYCVLKQSFPDAETYQRVRDAMGQATSAWEAACGVKFEHLSRFDDHPDPATSAKAISPELVFSVRFIDAQGIFIASAFFPTYPPPRRRVLIDPSFFAPDQRFDTTGVLRHELGHVLGFRHEHIRSGAPAVCPDEPLYDVQDLTAYDPQSVMHYFCGGVGSPSLALTELDRIGARSVYGPSFAELMLVE